MLLAAVVGLCGCVAPPQAPSLADPFSGQQRQVWAVAPIRNESGSQYADGLIFADHLTRQLENTPNLDVLPVNRTLAVMEREQLPRIASQADALRVLQALGADALVVGSISAYDPYDPPKVGLAVELYTLAAIPPPQAIDLMAMRTAAVDEMARLDDRPHAEQPVATAGGFFDAADPTVLGMLERYAYHRGVAPGVEAVRLHRINMDLFNQFVCHVVGQQLLLAQANRFATAQPADQSRPER
jgi:hypothetical protein